MENTEVKIKISDFVNGYTKMKVHSKDDFNSYANNKKLSVKTYLPFTTKIALAENIVKVSCHDQDGNVHVDSTMRYFLYVRTIIEQYTNLEIESNDFIEEYDLLASSGILEKVMDMIPEIERNEFKTVLDMEYDDLVTNYYEPHAYVDKQITRLVGVIKEVGTPLIGVLNDRLAGMSDDDFGEIVKRVVALFER